MIQTEICLRQPKSSRQDHPREVFRSGFHHAGLDGLAVSLESRTGLFEVDKHAQQTVPAIWLQFCWHRLTNSREI
jgi:hypothetical protein